MRTLSLLWVFLSLVLAGCALQGGPAVDNERAAQANADLGIEYMRQGDYARALVKLRRALEQDNRLVDAHSGIALLYQQQQENEQAEIHYKKALSLSGGEPNVQNNYAIFLCSQGRQEEALGYFLKVAQNPAYPQPELAYTNAAVCARRIPNNEQALTHLRAALKRNPQFAEALAQMALIHYDQGDYTRTRAFVQRYEAVAPESPQILLLAMRTERRLGNTRGAERYEKRLRTAYPEIKTR